MVDIVPAVMPRSLVDMRNKMERVKSAVSMVQIDIMDGKFVESVSWPYIDGGMDEFREFVRDGEGFPFWDEIDFSVDLMVENPKDVVTDWVRVGADRVLVHIESIENYDVQIPELREMLSDVQFGIAINTDTDNAILAPYVDQIDLVQCMGISKIGYQGQAFDDRVVGKIGFFKDLGVAVSVDGGVSLATAPALKEAGADILVSGSTVYGSDDIVEAIKALKNA